MHKMKLGRLVKVERTPHSTTTRARYVATDRPAAEPWTSMTNPRPICGCRSSTEHWTSTANSGRAELFKIVSSSSSTLVHLGNSAVQVCLESST